MNRSEDKALIKQLKSPIKDEAIVADVLKTLRSHPALELAREQMLQFTREARAALGPLPVNDVTGALYLLCDAIVDRSA
jgi:heptaprenyl diphosphate synthase